MQGNATVFNPSHVVFVLESLIFAVDLNAPRYGLHQSCTNTTGPAYTRARLY